MTDFKGAVFFVSSLTDYLTEKYGDGDAKIVLSDCAVWSKFRNSEFTSTEIDVACVVDVIVRKYGATAERELFAGVITHWNWSSETIAKVNKLLT